MTVSEVRISEFEKMVLEAIYTGKSDVKDISSSTSLPETVVEASVRRLIEKKLVDEFLNITEEAMQLIGATEEYRWERSALRMLIDVLIFSIGILLLLYLIEVIT